MEIKTFSIEVSVDANAVKSIRHLTVVFSDAQTASEFEKFITGIPHTCIANTIDLSMCENVIIWKDCKNGENVLGVSIGDDCLNDSFEL